MDFVSIEIRSETRLRLGFSESLAVGAFAVGLYTVTSSAARGADPEVRAALIVASNTSMVELALGDDLVPGEIYTVDVVGVPALAGGTCSGSLQCSKGARGNRAANQPHMALALGVDIAFMESDLVCAGSGDLSEVFGEECARRDLMFRAGSNGLPWDPEFGAKLRAAVDGSALTLASLRGRVLSQILKDSRVVRAAVAVLPVDDDGNGWISIDVQLIDGSNVYSEIGVTGA